MYVYIYIYVCLKKKKYINIFGKINKYIYIYIYKDIMIIKLAPTTESMTPWVFAHLTGPYQGSMVVPGNSANVTLLGW